MGNLMQEKRGRWGSKFGFIMAAVGGAVGLGNIWRFPYITGLHGGAIFLLVYVLIVLVLGIPMVSLELCVGRRSKSSIVGQTFKTDKHNWKFLGWIAIITCFLMVSYYLVIGGYIVKYFCGYVAGGGFLKGGNADEVFNAFVTNKWQSAIFNGVFLLLCLVVLAFGIKNGIERVSKILMPSLFIMLVFVMVCSLCMPNAIDGVKFFLVPNFDAMQDSGGIFGLIEAAMGQAFFSLSIGMGVTITYGSYLPKESNIAKNSIIICALDSLVAIIAGLAVLPAIFSSGQSPTAGAGLLFIALPNVFSNLGIFGNALAIIFFLLVFFAALTSAISVLEVLVCSLHEKLRKPRIWSVLIVGVAILISSVTVSLSQSGIFGIDLLELFDMITVKFLLPITAFFVCLFATFIWGKNNAVNELTRHVYNHQKWSILWQASTSYISPILIFGIFIAGLFSLNFSAIFF